MRVGLEVLGVQVRWSTCGTRWRSRLANSSSASSSIDWACGRAENSSCSSESGRNRRFRRRRIRPMTLTLAMSPNAPFTGFSEGPRGACHTGGLPVGSFAGTTSLPAGWPLCRRRTASRCAVGDRVHRTPELSGLDGVPSCCDIASLGRYRRSVCPSAVPAQSDGARPSAAEHGSRPLATAPSRDTPLSSRSPTPGGVHTGVMPASSGFLCDQGRRVGQLTMRCIGRLAG